MRLIIMHKCYLLAGEDPVMSDSCDLFEADSNTLLWNSLDYTDMLAFNKHKYTFINGKLPEHLFDHMVEDFKPIKEALDELLDEVEEHRIVVVARIKEDVDKRTKGIMIFKDQFPDNPKYPSPKINMYKLEVKQIISDRDKDHIHLKIPRPLRMDGSTELFDSDKEIGFAYSGNGKDKKKISVQKKPNTLASEHHENHVHNLFYVEEDEPAPITAKIKKDYGPEGEILKVEGQEIPENFMEKFMKSNNEKEHDSAMQMASFAHAMHTPNIPGHYYGENPTAQIPYKRRLLLSKRIHRKHPIYRQFHRKNPIHKRWPNLV